MYKICGNRGIYKFCGNRGICNMHHWLRRDGCPWYLVPYHSHVATRAPYSQLTAEFASVADEIGLANNNSQVTHRQQIQMVVFGFQVRN